MDEIDIDELTTLIAEGLNGPPAVSDEEEAVADQLASEGN